MSLIEELLFLSHVEESSVRVLSGWSVRVDHLSWGLLERGFDVIENMVGNPVKDSLGNRGLQRVFVGSLQVSDVVVVFSILEDREFIVEDLFEVFHGVEVACLHLVDHCQSVLQLIIFGDLPLSLRRLDSLVLSFELGILNGFLIQIFLREA